MKNKVVRLCFVVPLLFICGCERRRFVDSVKAICYFHYEENNSEKSLASGLYRIAINTYPENKYLNKELKHRIEGQQTFETTTTVKFQYEISFHFSEISNISIDSEEKQKLLILDGDKVVVSYTYKVNFVLDN